MVYKKESTNLPAVLILALIAGVTVTVIIAMITATLISAETVEVDSANIGAMASLLLGSLTASAVASGKTGKMRLPMCMAGTGVYFLGLLCCAAILFDGVKSGVGASALVALAGCFVVCLLGLRGEKRPKYKLPKIRS